MVNVIICGTPGTGKSSLIEKLKSDESIGAQYEFINLSKFAIENECTSGYDDELECHEIDEDKLYDLIEPKLKDAKDVIVECIHADMLEPGLIDLVFVMRTNNTQLYDRLKSRGYGEEKISNNLEAEIFQTTLDEAREAFACKVLELRNDCPSDLDLNFEIVKEELSQLCQIDAQ